MDPCDFCIHIEVRSLFRFSPSPHVTYNIIRASYFFPLVRCIILSYIPTFVDPNDARGRATIEREKIILSAQQEILINTHAYNYRPPWWKSLITVIQYTVCTVYRVYIYNNGSSFFLRRRFRTSDGGQCWTKKITLKRISINDDRLILSRWPPSPSPHGGRSCGRFMIFYINTNAFKRVRLGRGRIYRTMVTG